MVEVLDTVGVSAFALSGAALGLQRRFDVVGVVTLAIMTGLAGGVLRDLLLGHTPPVALVEQERLIVPVAATALMCLVPRVFQRLYRPVLVLDAVGLGLFAVVGAMRAVEAGLGIGASTAVGAVSAAGGGIARDVLVGRTPTVFTADSGLYVIAASIGALAVSVATSLVPDPDATVLTWIIVGAAVVVVSIRLGSLQFNWSAPTFVAPSYVEGSAPAGAVQKSSTARHESTMRNMP